MRGKIRNKQQSLVVKDYSGLRYDNITPTDLDGFCEIHDKHYVFLELKYGNAPLPRGQELALVRLTDAVAKAGKISILIIATHMIEGTGTEIDVANLCVTDVWMGGDKDWRHFSDHTYSVRQCIDDFLAL